MDLFLGLIFSNFSMRMGLGGNEIAGAAAVVGVEMLQEVAG